MFVPYIHVVCEFAVLYHGIYWLMLTDDKPND